MDGGIRTSGRGSRRTACRGLRASGLLLSMAIVGVLVVQVALPNFDRLGSSSSSKPSTSVPPAPSSTAAASCPASPSTELSSSLGSPVPSDSQPTASLAPAATPPIPSPEGGRPRIASGQVLRRDDGSVDARVSLLAPRADGDVRAVETWTFPVSGPVISEGTYVEFYPRPGRNMILVRVGGLGAFLWTLGAPPVPLEWPDELLHASPLRWSPDGRALAGYAWPVTIVLWEPAEDTIRQIDAPGSVIGWTADSTQLIVFTDPIRVPASSPLAGCHHDPWSSLVDPDTGITTPLPRAGLIDAVGGIRSRSVSPSVASAALAVRADGQVTVYADCQDLTVGGTPLVLPEAAQARDLAWSQDGRTLFVLAADGNRSTLLRYDRLHEGPQPGRVITDELPPDATVTGASARGRWVLLAGDDFGCLTRELLDTETGTRWRLGRWQETSALVP